jgi:hypothetical protein
LLNKYDKKKTELPKTEVKAVLCCGKYRARNLTWERIFPDDKKGWLYEQRTL